MVSIFFGVIDQPYTFPPPAKKAKAKKGKTKPKKAKAPEPVVTTGQVAEWLEEDYGVVEFFFERHEKEILKALEEGLQGAFESMLMGAPSSPNPYASGCSEVEELFKRFLEQKEMDGKVDGVPTLASKLGISHRFKKKRGPPRPSFIDTGLYVNSFKCWVE